VAQVSDNLARRVWRVSTTNATDQRATAVDFNFKTDGAGRSVAWVCYLSFLGVIMASQTICIRCDSSPFILFTKLLEGRLKVSERTLDLSNFGFELFRIESDFSSTAAGELIVRLYPSDSFFRFATTILAGDFDLVLVE
jgi:hypothetical protein